jgi:hypothetical protein
LTASFFETNQPIEIRYVQATPNNVKSHIIHKSLELSSAFHANILKLEAIIAQYHPVGKAHGKSQRPVLRSGFEVYRHVCDCCLTSIFNDHYFCPTCAVDICYQCYNNWSEIKKDATKTACHDGLSFSPQVFTLAKKYSEQDIDVVMDELDAIDTSDRSNVPSNKYDHIDDVKVTEAIDRSLPTTVANAATMTTEKFQEILQDKNPLLVKNCMDGTKVLWEPAYFGEKYGAREIEVIDCKDGPKRASTTKEFFESYESEDKLSEYCKKLGTSNMI